MQLQSKELSTINYFKYVTLMHFSNHKLVSKKRTNMFVVCQFFTLKIQINHSEKDIHLVEVERNI